MPPSSHLRPPFLGRWCLPLGKWEETCRPAVKARFADADNSVWERGPLNADGEEVVPLPRPDPDRRGGEKERKADPTEEEDGRPLFARCK
jgi:hypothetical protein